MCDDDDDGSEDMQEEDDDAATKLANELRESCFNGFQSFILRRPVEIQPHLPQIVHSALAYTRFDPNYSYGDEEAGASDDEYGMDDEDEGDEYSDEEDDYSDDDDDSWKVRRSAIRTLAAVVNASEKNLSSLWNIQYALRKNKSWQATVAEALVNRFKERDENCRIDIIECFNSLLKCTVKVAANDGIDFTSSESMDVEVSAQVVKNFQATYVDAIISGCEKQLSAKKAGLQTKSAALSLLSTLCTAPGGVGGASNINSLFQQIASIFTQSNQGGAHTGSNKQLKLDALLLVHTVIKSGQHDPVDVKNKIIEVLLGVLCKVVHENWYKLISETLKVLTAIPVLLGESKSSDEELNAASSTLYNAIEPRLAANDFDNDIKLAALDATASLLSNLHLNLSVEQKQRLLSLILLRLKNETTRIAAMKAINLISESNKSVGKVDLMSFLSEFVIELTALLRHNSRTVKQHAIICIDTLINSHGVTAVHEGKSQNLGAVIQNLSANIYDSSDFFIVHLSLQASLSILDESSLCGSVVKEHLLPAVIQLCGSPSLQDKALDSLLGVIQKLVTCNIIGFNELFEALQSKLPKVPQSLEENQAHSESSAKKVIGNIAKCLAIITSSTSETKRIEVVTDLMNVLGNGLSNDNVYSIMLALRMSGDLGCTVELSAIDVVREKLQFTYISYFDSHVEDVKNSHVEDVKNSAAYGLGRASVGSIAEFLPNILNALEESSGKKKYLLLSAIREMICCYKLGFGNDISPIVEQILPHLKQNFGDKEEGVRTIIADCMGSLVCLKPDNILPELQNIHSQNATEPLVCWTIASTVKFAVSGGCDGKKLQPFMPTFLKLLTSGDLNVKNSALLMVYASMHHNPQLVLPSMEETIQPALLEVSIYQSILSVKSKFTANLLCSFISLFVGCSIKKETCD
jgi:cullin-associated NEDD8-dissociated protein 1